MPYSLVEAVMDRVVHAQVLERNSGMDWELVMHMFVALFSLCGTDANQSIEQQLLQLRGILKELLTWPDVTDRTVEAFSCHRCRRQLALCCVVVSTQLCVLGKMWLVVYVPQCTLVSEQGANCLTSPVLQSLQDMPVFHAVSITLST